MPARQIDCLCQWLSPSDAAKKVTLHLRGFCAPFLRPGATNHTNLGLFAHTQGCLCFLLALLLPGYSQHQDELKPSIASIQRLVVN